MLSQAPWAIPTAIAVLRVEARGSRPASTRPIAELIYDDRICVLLCTRSTTTGSYFGQGEARYAH